MQTSPLDITQAVWNLAAGALGALAAGFYGVRFGLTKFRGERAFDQRLDWYRSMADSITSLRNRSATFEHMVMHGAPHPEIMKMGLDLVELTKAFHDLSNSAELYARVDTYDVIQATLATM